MIMRRILSLTYIILIISMLSCNKASLSNGKVITENRILPAFDTLCINDNIDITLIKSDSNYIEITTGENLMNNIITEVIDSVFYIRNDNSFNWIRSYDIPLEAKIYYSTALVCINFSSVANLRSEGSINTTNHSRFDINLLEGSGDIDIELNILHCYLKTLYGTSKITLKGKADYSNFYHRSFGCIQANDFTSRFINVHTESSNDIYLHCTDSLHSYINDLGNIYYLGNPVIESYVAPHARGRLIPFIP